MFYSSLNCIDYALFIDISNEIASKMPLQPDIIGATYVPARALP